MKLSIIGSGAMGIGIALVAAVVGHEVTLIDVSDEILAKALGNIQKNLVKLSEKGKLKGSPQEVFKLIRPEGNISAGVGDADFVIEAAFESIDLKKKIFAEIDASAPKHAVLATNTSSLSVTAISETTKRPQRIIGMHWFNPAQIMKLVEVTKSKYTNEETYNTTLNLCRTYGKEPISVQKDVWFFLAVRSKLGVSFEANLMYLNKEFTFKEIDAVMRYKLGLPMGEFELMDFTGAVDIRTGSLESTEKILADFPEFEPSRTFLSIFRHLSNEIWKPMRQKGLSGIKTGEGFYTYPGGYTKPEISAELATKLEPVQIIAPSINLAASCVADGIGTIEDINKAFRLAYGWPKGIFDYIDEYGITSIIKVLKEKEQKAPTWLKEFYQPSNLLVARK